jgi:hypothetical protein
MVKGNGSFSGVRASDLARCHSKLRHDPFLGSTLTPRDELANGEIMLPSQSGHSDVK